jgi:type 1 glutamine amidotransferase
MRHSRLVCAALLLAAVLGAVVAASQPAPLRIFLRGGPKTHGPATNGQHDGPTWIKEWQPLLASRGAKVEASLQFPTADQLENTDVLVMFAANAGNIAGDQRASLEKFLKRGGGIVCLHDAVLAQEPHWFKTIIGGAWENGVAKYFEGENTYYYVNTEHPITKGASNFTLTDEVYWDLHMMPDAHVLAVSMQPVRPARGAAPPPEPQIGKLIPQMWTYEHQLPGGQPYRAVVSLLGHHFTTFSSPHVRAIFLRAIAWAGQRDADLLATPEELAALR